MCAHPTHGSFVPYECDFIPVILVVLTLTSFFNSTTVPPRPKSLMGNHTVPVNSNCWHAAPMTGSARNHLRHLLIAVLGDAAINPHSCVFCCLVVFP